jgi:hypothetical protein
MGGGNLGDDRAPLDGCAVKVRSTFGPFFSKVSTSIFPALLTLTLQVASLIANTCTSPSLWPSFKMQGASRAGAGGLAGTWIFSKARLSPRIVVIPVKVITAGFTVGC